MRHFHIPVMLVLLYAATLAMPLWPMVDYAVNKDYIATVLCVNRNRPELQCEGKCHLTKMMAATQEQSDQQQEGMPVEFMVAFSVHPCIVFSYSFELAVAINKLYQLVKNQELPVDMFDGRVFHPPRC